MSTVQRTIRRQRKPKWRHHTYAAWKYDVNGDGMSPFFIGMAAAEFLPADPAWLGSGLRLGDDLKQ
jgi:hypothetical protein